MYVATAVATQLRKKCIHLSHTITLFQIASFLRKVHGKDPSVSTPLRHATLIQSLLKAICSLQLTTPPSPRHGSRRIAAMKAQRNRHPLPRFMSSLSCEVSLVCPWSWLLSSLGRSLRC
jgi:hypothetical protein